MPYKERRNVSADVHEPPMMRGNRLFHCQLMGVGEHVSPLLAGERPVTLRYHRSRPWRDDYGLLHEEESSDFRLGPSLWRGYKVRHE
jgi:hypothetical protein